MMAGPQRHIELPIAFNYNPEVAALFAKDTREFAFAIVPRAGQLLHQPCMDLIVERARPMWRGTR